jgi:drug/metabolite transporter (DMT)-like permease
MPSDLTGILCALLSALTWGGGDFCGGAATKRNNVFQVMATAALSGLVLLAGLAILRGESFPQPIGILYAALAGACGAAGMAALYYALSLGYTAMVAPTSAVIGAGIPVVFAGLTLGLPAPARLAGFGLALAGIWLVSRPAEQGRGVSRTAFLLACFAGICFGGFFILIVQVGPGVVFTPLVVSRCLTLLTAFLLLRIRRLPWVPPTAHPIGLAAGLLDAGGNIFYVLAGQLTRLDAAAVLVSLFPATTVLLARIFWREQISRGQWAGVALCLAAIILIIL